MKPVPVQRSELLQVLQAVQPGLSSAPTVEQANCFCFRGGRVFTFDMETYCRMKTPLPDELTCAVQGKPLLDALEALDVDSIEVSHEEGRLIMKGRRDEVYVRCDDTIQMPVEAVDRPKTWTPITQEFSEAMLAVSEVCGRDGSKFLATVVHLTPKYMQATDGFSFCRYRVKTGLVDAALVRSAAAKAVAARGPTKLGETKDWLHFKTAAGLYVSVRRFDPAENEGEKLDRFDGETKLRGTPVQFPKSVVAASKVAEVFSAEYSDDNRVTIELKAGRVRMTGEGVSGGASHRAKVDYAGPEVAFTVGPKILAAVVQKHSEIQVADRRLIVAAGRLFYSTSTKEAGNGRAPKKEKSRETE